MASLVSRRSSSSQLLARLIHAPDLVRRVRAMPEDAFSALVREVGVADAGELVALATPDQLVAALDEDLFVGDAPGEREVFDAERFVVWLEVLLEAGEAALVQRVSELSEDFVTHALSQLMWVFEEEQLRVCLTNDTRGIAEKLLESALSEEIDGYVLVAKLEQGWDATLTLVMALDRDQRELLERVLDRCAAAASDLVEDAEALTDALREAESIAEDAEAEREARRARRGFVEPRAAKNFLTLARKPLPADILTAERDPVTRAYFRDLGRVTAKRKSDRPRATSVIEGGAVGRALARVPVAPPAEAPLRFRDALQALAQIAPERFEERLEELAYITNALAAGGTDDVGQALGRAAAAEAALSTVAYGAELEAWTFLERGSDETLETALRDVVERCSADLLFRRASSLLCEEEPTSLGFILTRAELEERLSELDAE